MSPEPLSTHVHARTQAARFFRLEPGKLGIGHQGSFSRQLSACGRETLAPGFQDNSNGESHRIARSGWSSHLKADHALAGAGGMDGADSALCL